VNDIINSTAFRCLCHVSVFKHSWTAPILTSHKLPILFHQQWLYDRLAVKNIKNLLIRCVRLQSSFFWRGKFFDANMLKGSVETCLRCRGLIKITGNIIWRRGDIIYSVSLVARGVRSEYSDNTSYNNSTVNA